MKKTLVILCIIFMFTPMTLAESNTLTYNFPQPVITNWNSFTRVEMEGLQWISIPGHPILPVKTAKILIPSGKKIASISITPNSQKKIHLESLVSPGSHVRPLSMKVDGPIPPPKPDPVIYSSRSGYPDTKPDFMIQSMVGYDIVILRLYPVQYLPMEDTILVSEEIVVTVTFQESGRTSKNLRHANGDGERVKKFVDNPQELEKTKVEERVSEYEYIIITNRTLKDSTDTYNFQTLLQSKIDQGMTGKIELVEDIEASYPGNNLGEKIRNYITYAYQNWGTTYVLLGGDADAKQMSVIPAVGFYAEAEGYTDKTIPADLYYGCLDGNFDYNKNGILGEPGDGPDGGEVDLLAEVFVGRASVDSVQELSNFVRKTLYYQNLPQNTPYLNNSLMAGEYLWTSNTNGPIWGGDHMDQLIGSSQAHNINTTGIPLAANFLKFYERDNTFNVADLKNAIKTGVHYINHLGHSDNTSNMKLSNSDIPNLGNPDLYFFGYTQGCYAGSFDNKHYWGSILTSDSILEEMVSGSVGAFAYIGNSRYGWGDDNTTKGPSHMYHRQFYHGRFHEGIKQLGRLNQFSKEANIGIINNTAMRWCYYQVTLFGDPALELKSPVIGK